MSIVVIEDKPGRPPVNIDLSQAEQLCQMGSTLREVAGFFRCSEDTIQRVLKRERQQTFREFFDQWSALGDISLRRAQYLKAQGGDVKMLIWLGKQRLGQTDKQEVSLPGVGAVKLVITKGKAEEGRGDD